MNRFEMYEALNVGKPETVDTETLAGEFMKLMEENKIMADTIRSLAVSCSKAKIIIDQVMNENAKLSFSLREAIKKNIRGN